MCLTLMTLLGIHVHVYAYPPLCSGERSCLLVMERSCLAVPAVAVGSESESTEVDSREGDLEQVMETSIP